MQNIQKFQDVSKRLKLWVNLLLLVITGPWMTLENFSFFERKIGVEWQHVEDVLQQQIEVIASRLVNRPRQTSHPSTVFEFLKIPWDCIGFCNNYFQNRLKFRSLQSRRVLKNFVSFMNFNSGDLVILDTDNDRR